jgi:hypothetical protein
MRLHESIDLGGGEIAIIREARVADVRNLLAAMPTDLHGVSIQDAIREHAPKFLALAQDAGMVTLPTGRAMDDLALSELATLAEVLIRLHRSFFDRMTRAIQGASAPDDAAGGKPRPRKPLPTTPAD